MQTVGILLGPEEGVTDEGGGEKEVIVVVEGIPPMLGVVAFENTNAVVVVVP